MNKECNYIQDLLPNYIDGLTSLESTNLIKSHLKHCSECRKIYENMNLNFNINSNENFNKEIKFAKKFKRKFRFLQIVILIFLLIFIISTTKNTFILLSLSKKAEDFQNKSNYYLKYYQYDINSIQSIESFNKDGKSLKILKSLNKNTLEETSKISSYFDGKTVTLFQDDVEPKTALTNAIDGHIPSMFYKQKLEDLAPLYFISFCLFGNIKSVQCNGIECYKIQEFSFDSSEKYIYIDKSTGLPVRIYGNWHAYKTNSDEFFEYNLLQDFYYSFDTVKTEDLTPPDITEYIIEEY